MPARVSATIGSEVWPSIEACRSQAARQRTGSTSDCDGRSVRSRGAPTTSSGSGRGGRLRGALEREMQPPRVRR